MTTPTSSRVARWLLAAMIILAATHSARGVTQLKRGEAAPPVELKDERGAAVSLRGRIVVLVFGELYHGKTRQACTQIDAILHDPRLAGQDVLPVLITAQEPRPEHQKLAAGEHLPATILRDPNRRAFGDYQVAVLPSVVVIDKEGRVVLALAGLTSRFSDLLLDSLLFAAGKLSEEQFEAALNPKPTTTISDDLRIERVVQLGRQLARRGLDDMAAEKFREALVTDPNHLPARLELGMLLLKRQRLAEAETHFRAVLAAEPQSLQASLGLAFVQTLRGGAELDDAEQRLRDLMGKNPTQARVHYLLGLINEQRGKSQEAAAYFKRAAQLLLERSDEE